MEALGICVDGNGLKFAHLRKRKNLIEIIDLEKVFIKKTDKGKISQEETEEGYEDVLGLEVSDETAVQAEVTPELGDNAIFNAISKYSKKSLKAGMNILQSDVSFTNIFANLGSKEKNIKKKIREELEKISSDISDENFDFITKSRNEYIAFYHNNRLDLLNQILNVKSAIKSDIKIILIDINEIALINLFTNMIETDEEVNILVYVGNEFSRGLFFQGNKIIDFSQLINEGYHSDGLLTNLYGKIIFGIDTLGFEEINNIFITGDGNLSQYEEFFKERFHESVISKLPFENFFNIIDDSKKAEVDSFAIPISLAWKILEGKEKYFIDTNFLPTSIKKQQKAFNIAWHGFIIVILIILLGAYSYRENENINNEIKNIKSEISLLNMGIDEVTPVAQAVDSIANEIAKIKPNIVLVDKLKPENMLHSDLLKYLSNSVRNLNSIWVNEFSASGKTFSFSGNSLYRTRIHKLASAFEQSMINNVDSKQIMGKDIFDYNISGEIPGNE